MWLYEPSMRKSPTLSPTLEAISLKRRAALLEPIFWNGTESRRTCRSTRSTPSRFGEGSPQPPVVEELPQPESAVVVEASEVVEALSLLITPEAIVESIAAVYVRFVGRLASSGE